MRPLKVPESELLYFISRIGITLPEHLETRFEIHRSTAYKRLAELEEGGLIKSDHTIAPDRKVFAATRAGLNISYPPLRPAKASLSTFAHHNATAQVVAEFERIGVDCVTEREILNHERDWEDGRYLIDVDDSQTQRWVRHRPDIAIEVPGKDRFVAVEVELSPKSRERWRSILRGYDQAIGHRALAGVLYLVAPDAAPSRLIAQAEEARLDARFQVRLTTDSNRFQSINDILDVSSGRAA